jgi:quercetin dioxygenase-like cupin family protein
MKVIRRLISLACYLAVTSVAFAEISNSASAAGDEVKLDNERVTVSDITLSPGKPQSLEGHNHDFVTMYLIGGKFRVTDMVGHSHVVAHSAGDATFTPLGSEKLEEVVSEQPARIFIVDLKEYPASQATNTSKYADAFPRPGSTKVLENDHVVVWNYSWAPGVPTPMHYHFREVVVVYREDGSLKSTSLNGEVVVNNYTFGMVRFNRADRTHTEELVKGKESAIILELK